eukprot:CAMPEP_0180670728 /NCGR_PEP_ID=MMETSP1037_2-20121125/64193_1 /TAXON_ID=632150 /ORGANISM="Azadinium spinosum, Strain 3D9" /LENGTH=41 /DNA_ID= /DNA_START= /DNA_END= /DNA_ORIENTATION=
MASASSCVSRTLLVKLLPLVKPSKLRKALALAAVERAPRCI